MRTISYTFYTTFIFSKITVLNNYTLFSSLSLQSLPGQMETKDEDEAYISHLLSLPLPPPAQQNAALGPSTASLTRSFFSTLSSSERQRVFKAYEYDFLMFNYSYDDEDYT